MLEVSVIIPNYNGYKYLPVCLNALRKQTITNFEVILVDNGSTDESIELINRNYTEVKVIQLDDNYGFCRAVNEGIKASCAPFVILLNNDTEVEENFIEELLKAINRSERLFSCSAKMISYNDRTIMDGAGNLYCALGWAYARGVGKPCDKYNKNRRIFASCAGAAIYRKKIFDEIGLFDEEHFAYLEDIDIGYRAKIHGYENRYIASARVYHVGSGTTGSRYNKFKVKCTSRNSIYLVYKNMPLIQIIINLPLLIPGFFIKFLFFLRLGFGLDYLFGIVNGFKLSFRNKKVKFKRINLRNYIKIQLELWANVIRRISN